MCFKALGKPQAMISEDEHEASNGTVRRDDKRRRREVVLPFEPHSIVFDEVKYSVDMPQVIYLKIMRLQKL